MERKRINAVLTVAALALTLLIPTTLPQASTAAPRLERQPLESLTGLNSTEAAERSVLLSAFSAPSAASAVQSPGTTTRVSAALRSGPVMFIENVGQFDERARFQVRGGMSTMWLAEDAIWVTALEKPSYLQPPSPNLGEGEAFLPSPKFGRGAGGEGRGVHLKLTFPGANPHPRIEPFDRLDTVVSYFIGNDPAKWRSAVPVWGGVRYKDLYPGIDLEITGENGRLVQRLVAQPGADLNAVRLRVEGADEIALPPSAAVGGQPSAVVLTTAVGEYTLPLVVVEGANVEGLNVEHPRVERVNAQTFDITAPFTSAPLPPGSSAPLHPSTSAQGDLLYATFLGGSNSDWGDGIAVDGSGAAYVTGLTGSSDFPTTPGAFDTTHNGGYDAFVVKLNATGSALAYATFLGGGNSECYRGVGMECSIAADGSGAAYVTGVTGSSDFPTTPGAFDTTYNGGEDAFVVKLNASGSALAYATFLGGSNDECYYGCAIAVDGSGAAYVTGQTNSSNFPTTPGAFDTTFNGWWDAFVVKLNAAGSALVYATFLGGGGGDYGYGIAVDGSGAAYITGWTESSNFPTTPGAFDTTHNGGYRDAFVVKLNAAGSTLAYATFLGGGWEDSGRAIAVDGSGVAYVTGRTWSSDFPTTPGAFDTTHNGGYDDAFVVKLNATAMELVYSTFLGGSSYDEGKAIAVDGMGNGYVSGYTWSSNFPTTPGAFDTTHNGGYHDAFVVKLNATGSALAYATFLGGSSSDSGTGIAVDGNGATYVTGITNSSNFPTTPGAFDTTYNGSDAAAFVVKLAVGGGAGPDLWVDHIQVAQVFLADTDPANGQPIPLIAEKLTPVRVYVGVSGANSVPNVTARLYVQDAQGQVHVIDQTYNGMPITAKANPDPHNLNDTVNFLPQVAWLKDSVTFWAEVDPGNQVAESNEGNNTGGNIMKPFQAGPKLRIAWVEMPYAPPNPPPSLVYPDAAAAAAGFNFLQRIYPVGINDVEHFQQPTQMLEMMRSKFTVQAAISDYIPALDRFWQITTRRNGWQGGTPPDRLYGLVPDAARYTDLFGGTLCGIAASKWAGFQGRVAAGLDSEQCREWTPAHELGHLLNSIELRHAPGCGAAGPDPSYPYTNPQGSIGEWGVNLWGSQNPLLSPAQTYDFMSYCSPKWISPYNYNKLPQGFEPMAVQRQAVSVLSAPQQQLLVSGLVYTPSFTVTFGTFYPLTSTVPTDASSGTAYCLELRSAAEAVLDSRCFDLTFTNPETGEPVNAEAFTLVLPYPEGTRSIVLTHQGEELGRVVASNNAPSVQLISPNGGESWGAGGTYTVTWTASDPDNDLLRFIASYSPDNGTMWMPLALDISTSYLVIDSHNLPGSTSALFKVEATDQMHMAEDVSDALFTVERKGPQAFILSPEGAITITVGTPLLLQGYAYDLEDGTLGDASLSWSSSRDGDLGTGAQVLTTLSLGRHTLTFTATDSDANMATATVQVLATFPEDVVPDCRVDIADIMQVASHWRCRCGDECYDPRYDLDGDCDIDIVDIMLVVKHWGETCE